jgi:hypothetical protein
MMLALQFVRGKIYLLFPLSLNHFGKSLLNASHTEWFLQPPTGNGIVTENSGISGLISRADVAALVSDLLFLVLQLTLVAVFWTFN